MKKKISILGSTGSIGVSALDVIERHSDDFEVVALAAGSNFTLLADQIKQFKPKFVSVKDDIVRSGLKELIPSDIEILIGEEGAIAVATDGEVDTVLSSMVGAVGLKPTFEAIQAKKTIALANKETLVAAGSIMMDAVKESGVRLLPVDSEHSAIFQSIEGHSFAGINKLILTASGGPFWNYTGDFKDITVEQALKHPNWSMGQKITIDSATMMNKGLEVIEAHWLFDLPEEKIEVVIHPQSIVHSMVEYRDGAIMAELGHPDMRTPIAYALSYPERIESGVGSINWEQLQDLTFAKPDSNKFPMLDLAREAIRSGGSMAAVMNAANEIAVDAFLNKKIGFTDICKIVQSSMEAHEKRDLKNIDDVLDVDKEGRRLAENQIGKLG